MRPGGGREKGNTFERKVAKLIRIAARRSGVKVKKQDAYRTPGSGGHRYASKEDPSDLVISKRLREHFPFVVECKHYKRIRFMELLNPAFKRGIHVWVDQVIRCVTGKKLMYPLLVMMENRGNIYCAFPDSVRVFIISRRSSRRLQFIHKDEVWHLMLFSTFLKAVFKVKE